MAFVRTFLIVTFDDGDTLQDKEILRKVYEGQGYSQISEVGLNMPGVNKTKIVKEWMFASPPIIGKVEGMPGLDNRTDGQKKAELFNFNAKGEG